MFMGMAKVAALRSTCFRLNVGAILVHDNNVISIGYNGAPSGEPHCGGDRCEHFDGGACRVTHAERNALQRARYPELLVGLSLYTTHAPCVGCADLLCRVMDGGRIFYEIPYRDPTGLNRVIQSQLQVYRIQPSGYIIDARTNELTNPE